MTVGTQTRSASYTANGVTTEFEAPFQFFELAVYADTVLVDPSEYAVNQTELGAEGSVTFNTAPPSGTKVRVLSNTTVSQETDYVENDGFEAETHERALDRVTMALQDLRRDLVNVSSIDWLQYPGRIITVDDDGAFVPLDPTTGGYVYVDADGVATIEEPAADTPTTIAGVTQNVKGLMLRVGDMVLSMSPTAGAGRLRLGQAPTTYNKSAYPELSAWLAALSTPYPWGSTSTTFTLPPAAGYALRFAGTDATIDPDGPRLAGSTQADSFKSHNHSGETDPDGQHDHYTGSVNALSQSGSGAVPKGSASPPSGDVTSRDDPHSHLFLTDETGDVETRGKNVAYHVDVVASSADSMAVLGSFGFPFAMDTTTTPSGIATGTVRLNHASLASVTAVYVHKTDRLGVSLGTLLGDFSTNTLLKFSNVGAPGNCLVARVTSPPTDGGTYYTFAVAVRASNGSFDNASSLALEPFGSIGV